jgi:hypothetical protein
MTTLWKKYHTLEKEYHPRLRLGWYSFSRVWYFFQMCYNILVACYNKLVTCYNVLITCYYKHSAFSWGCYGRLPHEGKNITLWKKNITLDFVSGDILFSDGIQYNKKNILPLVEGVMVDDHTLEKISHSEKRISSSNSSRVIFFFQSVIFIQHELCADDQLKNLDVLMFYLPYTPATKKY